MMIRPVVLADDLDEGPGFSYLWGEAPFTGLAVDLREDGSVEGLIEIANGRHHGYVVDCDAQERPRYVAQYYYHRLHGLQAEWDADGRLIQAERHEEDFLTQHLDIDSNTGATALVDTANFADQIAEARAQITMQSPPMTKNVYELLSDFTAAWPGLLQEAKSGLRLA